MRRPRLWLLLAPLALAGCSYVHSQSTAPYRPAGGLTGGEGTPPNGFAMYQRDCGWCHGNEGRGTSNGPSLIGGTNGPALTDFMLTTGRMPIAVPGQKDALHQNSIYNQAQVDALVSVVSSFNQNAPMPGTGDASLSGSGGPAIPVVNLSAGNLQDGQQLYQANCAACHSVTGAGGVLATGRAATVNGFALQTKGLVVPSVYKSSPLQVLEAIRTGPPGMPVFGSSEISDAQAASIAQYVSFLRTAPDRGGLSLGRIGPVAEGAVGWIAGLGLLLLLVRWIGTSGGEGRHSRSHGALDDPEEGHQ